MKGLNMYFKNSNENNVFTGVSDSKALEILEMKPFLDPMSDEEWLEYVLAWQSWEENNSIS